jgi:hypothetical protein
MSMDAYAHLASVKSPGWPLAAAGASAVAASLAVVVAEHNAAAAVAGYVIGALVVPAFTIVHRFLRQAAAKNPYFLPNRTVGRALLGVLGLGLSAGVVNAWFFATEVAKR